MSFPTTAWSMIANAKAERLAAMNRSIVGYWRPIYRFIRAKGHRRNTAEDLTREFLLKFLDRDWALTSPRPSISMVHGQGLMI